MTSCRGDFPSHGNNTARPDGLHAVALLARIGLCGKVLADLRGIGTPSPGARGGSGMTARQWRGTVLGAAIVLSTAVEAQVRPLSRPADLGSPASEPTSEDVVAVAGPAPAGGVPAAIVAPAPTVGPVTGLPLPRYVSLKTDEGNARHGPAIEHSINWVFVREDMPLLITAEYDNWRRVEDRDGEGGWVHYSLLSGARTVIVDRDRLPLRSRPEDNATEVALLEQNVIARLETCEVEWCRISAGGYGGWAPKTALWGVGVDEVLH